MSTKRRPGVLIGGKRRDAQCYFERIDARAKALAAADRPKIERKLKPGEERQLMLPGVTR